MGDDGEARRLPVLPRLVELTGVRTGGPSGHGTTWGDDWVGAWESLPRGDALLILARAAGMPPAALARVACALVRRVLPLARRMPNGAADGRPEAALAAVEAALAPGLGPGAAGRARSLAEACEAAGSADYARGYRYRPGYHVAKAIRYAADAAAGVEAAGGRSSAGFAASSAAAAKNAEAWARGPVGSELRRATEAEDAERRAQAEVVRAAFPLPALLLRATGAE